MKPCAAFSCHSWGTCHANQSARACSWQLGTRGVLSCTPHHHTWPGLAAPCPSPITTTSLTIAARCLAHGMAPLHSIIDQQFDRCQSLPSWHGPWDVQSMFELHCWRCRGGLLDLLRPTCTAASSRTVDPPNTAPPPFARAPSAEPPGRPVLQRCGSCCPRLTCRPGRCCCSPGLCQHAPRHAHTHTFSLFLFLLLAS